MTVETKEMPDLIEEVRGDFSAWKADIERWVGEVEKKASRPAFGFETAGTPHVSEEQKQAINLYLRKGVESKAMMIADDPNGGYAVTPQLGPAIETVIREVSPFHSLAGSVTVSTDRYQLVQA